MSVVTAVRPRASLGIGPPGRKTLRPQKPSSGCGPRDVARAEGRGLLLPGAPPSPSFHGPDKGPGLLLCSGNACSRCCLRFAHTSSATLSVPGAPCICGFVYLCLPILPQLSPRIYPSDPGLLTAHLQGSCWGREVQGVNLLSKLY